MRVSQPEPAAVIARAPGAATSSVQKACRILRTLSDPRNARLTEIASSAGLDKATTLRLLDALAGDGFVLRDGATKRYSLGPEMLVLGAALQARFDLRPIVRPSLVRLAAVIEDTAILLRSERRRVESASTSSSGASRSAPTTSTSAAGGRSASARVASRCSPGCPTTRSRRSYRSSLLASGVTRESRRGCSRSRSRHPANGAMSCCWTSWWSGWAASRCRSPAPRPAGGSDQHRGAHRADHAARGGAGGGAEARGRGV